MTPIYESLKDIRRYLRLCLSPSPLHNPIGGVPGETPGTPGHSPGDPLGDPREPKEAIRESREIPVGHLRAHIFEIPSICLKIHAYL